MTDRIRAEFEIFAQSLGFDVQWHIDRYCRPVTRHMWAVWRHQSERITDMAAALERAHNRQTSLLNQCRDHDTRRAAAVAQAASLAEEVERLNTVIRQLTAECGVIMPMVG